MPVPEIRVRSVNAQPLRERDYVLYWMTASRRLTYNYALDHALDHAHRLRKPLVILEALRAGYRWASDRLHAFVLCGMADHAPALRGATVAYHPYVEPAPGAGRGLLQALARQACVVVTDDYPCFFLPRMLGSAARSLDVRLEAVDGNGLLPMRAATKVFERAYDFRRFLQKSLAPWLEQSPGAAPLEVKLPRAMLPDEVLKRWPAASPELLACDPAALAQLPIDHEVPVSQLRGGPVAAQAQLRGFMDRRYRLYGEQRNDPDEDASSGLSPWLHFGHVSVHKIFARVKEREEWAPARLAAKPNGSRDGWWGMSATAEAFLDELITWRELGFNMGWQRDDYDRYESLPAFARATLEAHAGDKRPHVYAREQFERALTHDALWNAAQRQLLAEGRIHNYLRMLWGKKILEWSASPRDALSTMIELNNRHALDGRDPNSYSGIFWVLGRYDRPWPERPIYGVVRSMSSENTAKKVSVEGYLAKWGRKRGMFD